MELWHAWPCPYCMRVRIALDEKRVPYAEREIDLADKPPELFAVNPAGGVPVLVVDGKAIPESAVILDWLEAHHPEPPLVPRDPAARDRARSLYDRATALLAPHTPKLARGTPEEKARAAEAVRAALAELERDAPEDGYLAGPFSIADISLATMIAKLPEPLRPAALGLPRLGRWQALVLARPSIARQTAPRRDGAPARG